MLGWLVGRGIDPHIPVWDQSEVAANGKFPRADFADDPERDLSICPGGKELTTSGTVHDGTTIKYLAKRSDCAVCPLRRHCTAGLERRRSRDVHQDARAYAQAPMQTGAYRVSRSARKKIETLFAEAKHIHSLVRLRLRGLSGARGEFLLTATIQNLKTPGNPRHQTAATAQDSLTQCQEIQLNYLDRPLPPQPIGSGGKTPFGRPEPDPQISRPPDFLNSLSH